MPPAPFTLEAGDVVQIDVEGVGALTTNVVRGLKALATGAHASPGRSPGSA
ncbi:MAG: hypothetical protein ABSE77_07260 [Acidimicrobiales bacterium]